MTERQPTIGIAGRPGMGGFELRGRMVADLNGWDVIDLTRRQPLDRFYDAIVLVKYPLGHEVKLRHGCKRLVWDPLDCWMRDRKTWYNRPPYEFWQHSREQIRFDDIIATSPSASKSMRAALGHEFPVHLLPHHADPRIGPVQHSRGGAVVYYGGLSYVKPALEPLTEACRRLGRQFRVDEAKRCWKIVQPTALVVHFRLGQHAAPINLAAKPQVKAANAVAAGLPMLGTDEPCIKSLYPAAYTITADDAVRPDRLADHIEAAVARGPVRGPVYTLEWYAEQLRRLVEGSAE